MVVSQPDRRRGRGASASPTPVKQAALALGLPVSERVQDAADVGAELGVVVAFGRLIKSDVLSRLPMVNMHFSLLPRWRGAAPVERAVLEGDTETGVCLMALEEGLDTGPVYAARRVRIGEDETVEELRARLVSEGTQMLLEGLVNGLSSLGEPVPQVGEPTYAAKLDPSELMLDWSLPAARLQRVVRVGRAWTTFRGRRLLVRRSTVVEAPAAAGGGPPVPGELHGSLVVAGEGVLELLEVQLEGRPVSSGRDWVRGARPRPGERLGT